MIQYALTEAQLDPTKEADYHGWRIVIMTFFGASSNKNGLDSIGVLYGFGEEETELQEAGANIPSNA